MKMNNQRHRVARPVLSIRKEFNVSDRLTVCTDASLVSLS